ncbi:MULTISPECIES: NosD domain-containing protein [Brevibacillus]|uniref:ABC transporter substrate-binding protein n=1 Tax=Brevibacillus invocatus TaxID=173959 RepID=A0A3M8BYL3_9BACL|nr:MULTISPECIES: NosD domain-containing protein [Brevibacillus]MCM3081538.1 right-handed parallel beta-helix repeat-containing protein [Brevibacillus invocatus]MCM3431893.1 right-handed parallel beta-helix repeat-containing protein [Brevibacillus invocatus]MDH4618680.1 right-handed parallel beta-helix repeat-containing protein [Brevibacillus sp. AY1]RNB68516.1 ABC transporter substrate-binding protein [Brevibacillus invocatus]
MILTSVIWLCLWVLPLSSHAAGAPADLQALIDKAAPGETVTIPAGEYAGPLRVTKPITLQASGEVIIRSATDDPVLTIESNNVTVSGLQLQDSRINNPLATLVVHGNQNVIEQIQIDTMGTGIQLLESSFNQLRNIRVTGHVLDPSEVAADIGHDHSAHQQLTKPVQQPGAEAKKGNGIDLRRSHQNQIIGNQILNLFDGIYLESSQENIIEQNQVAKSRYGIHLMGTSSTRIANNIGNGNVTGAMLMDTSTATVTNNRFLKQKDNPNSQGILLFSVTDSVLEGNHIEGNRVGLYLEQSTGNSVKNNALTLNFIGMQVKDTADNQLMSNQFVSNVIQAQAQDSKADSFDGNYWDNLQALDVNGDERSDLSYEMNPFFLALTDAVPPYQLFFQSPGFVFLESLFSVGGDQIRDTAPLMSPVIQDDLEGQQEATVGQTGLLGAGLLMFSFLFIYLGVRRK